MLKALRRNGVYENPWPCESSLPNLQKLLRWMTMRKSASCSCKHEHIAPAHMVPDFDYAQKEADDTGLSTVWLGHATVVVHFSQAVFITDPTLSRRCSPFPCFGPTRLGPIPCTVQDLPELDGVLISHNHYDHLDLKTVKSLNERFGQRLRWFVPSGLAAWFSSVGCGNVKEMTWLDEDTFDTSRGNKVRVVCLPSQHWSGRSLFDKNKSLWASWALIDSNDKRFFFAGDTGYCQIFEKIGQQYGPFHLSAIPIGCYEPRWFMKFQHADPDEAVQIHVDLKSNKSIGIHWGTYNMGSLEHHLEPPCKLMAACQRRGIGENSFVTLAHGEVSSCRADR